MVLTQLLPGNAEARIEAAVSTRYNIDGGDGPVGVIFGVAVVGV
jgi:hypothetical protein